MYAHEITLAPFDQNQNPLLLRRARPDDPR